MVEVKAWDYWSMFTSKGNKRITTLAEKFLEQLGDIEQANIEDFKKYGKEFMVSWKKLWGTKTYGESGDTAVREMIFGFIEQVGLAMSSPAYINMEVLIRQVFEEGYYA